MVVDVREDFGAVDGVPVHRYTLGGSGDGALRARILTYGCIVHTLEVPDRDGHRRNVVLGRPDIAGYREWSRYFGAVVGRYGNRIARGRFHLDGTEHRLVRNDGTASLHGGVRGFDKRVWEVIEATASRIGLRYVSPDGEEGYPGTLTATVTYTVEANTLRIDYRATTDAPTVVNLTNHSYFNLAGEDAGTVAGHTVRLDADRYLPVDDALVPTGEITQVAGTPFDLTAPRPIADGVDLFDHCFVVNHPGDLTRPVARVCEPGSGRVMQVLTTEPGVQFYAGGKLDSSGLPGTGGRPYRPGSGLCLETQHFPDSPNRPQFPSAALGPGQTYASRTIYRFSVME